MNIINESSLSDLYHSAVAAFPKTTRRQHVVHPIIVEQITYTPFLGMKTLFIKAEVRNENRHYNPMILLKKVDYNGSGVKIIASDDRKLYSFHPLSLENTDVLVRCNCSDFRYRFAYYNKLDRSLYGSPPAKYIANGMGPPANPLELEGMCKHLMKTMQVLRDSGILLE